MKKLFGKQHSYPIVTIQRALELANEMEADHEQDLPQLTIQGEVFAFDSINIRREKNPSFLIKGAIYDKTEEVPFSLFIPKEKFPDGISLKTGTWVQLEGKMEKNEYTQWDWSFNPSFVASIDAPVVDIKDTAPVTRVELSTFTQMTRMSSALPVEKLIEHAAQLGHSHVAITDVSSLQAYPAAHSAAGKHGVQVIYGATMNLADDTHKIVYGPETEEEIQNAVFTSFDVETTGFSTRYDQVIEIGAVKIQNGEVIARYQCFVKDTKPVPAHITDLTGITQEMVDKEGVSPEEAIDGFLAFQEGTILVAHNATFDRDFIVALCEKTGRTIGERTYVDTLEISRTLEPDAKSHRLNVVAKRFAKEHDTKLKELKKEKKPYDAIIKVKTALDKKIITFEKKINPKQKKNESDEKYAARIEELLASPAVVKMKEEITILQQQVDAEYTIAEQEIKRIQEEMEESEKRINDLSLNNHHRADEDAECAAHILYAMLQTLKQMNVTKVSDLNELIKGTEHTRTFPNKITVLAINDIGKKNLYKLMTVSQLELLHREPRITKTAINAHREGLLIGSGSHEGPLFELVSRKPIEQAEKEVAFYDYVEIQPSGIASYLIDENSMDSQEQIDETWKTIYQLGKKAGKPVVATGSVHYVDKDGELLHNALLYHAVAGLDYEKRKGSKLNYRQDKKFRNTEEMKQAFPWLTEEEKEEVVVTNSRWIAEQCEVISPVLKDLYPPKMENDKEELKAITLQRVHEIYGENYPEIIQKRLDKEFTSIIGNGFSVIYLISQKLVKNSNDNGYLVGSRGSVGSSFVATMMGITEVNPLKPHYVGEKSKWSVFFDHPEIGSGYDLPVVLGDLLNSEEYSEDCIRHVVSEVAKSIGKTEAEAIEFMKQHQPHTDPFDSTGALIRDGQDIPFETFLGFNGDKVPDIDLNFSGEYQTRSHKYVEELFGEKYVFRAGTISTVAVQKAFGYISSYGEENGYLWSKSKINRLASLMQGAKNTSGQHPGGILVVPDYMDPEDFTPVQHPAESREKSKGVRTSHFDFHSIHDNILKLDILGHDDPTITRMLQDITGVNPKTIAPNDPMALKLFTDPEEALGIPKSDIPAETGTLGVPEFGTKFVQQMILDTKPKKFSDLVSISGLSHGTDVWIGNAKDLIDKKIANISTVIDTRDSIMVYLMQKGIEPLTAFKIMEDVRKGKGLKPEYVDTMHENKVPEWYIESCEKIKYMFPKAHAAAYVLSAMRIANFKVYHPTAFYTAILSVRYGKESTFELSQPIPALRKRLKELETEIQQLLNNREKNKAGRIENLQKAMELVAEAKARGIEFGKVDLTKSHYKNYTIHDDVIIPPLMSIPGLGLEAAISAYREMRIKPFRTIEELNNRTKLTATNIAHLEDIGALETIKEVQYKLF